MNEHLTDDQIYGALNVVCPVCPASEGVYCTPQFNFIFSKEFLHTSRIPKD